MKWGWRRENDHTWRFNDRWMVAKDWSSDQWYVVRNGDWMLENYDSAQAAIAAAERLMDGAK